VREAVALYATNTEGAFLIVKRPDDDAKFPGLWSLAATHVRKDETVEAAVIRAARDKVGLEASIKRFVGEELQDRGSYLLHVAEHEIDIVGGVPQTLNADPLESKIVAVQWSSEPMLPRKAADLGSACSIIFLRNLGLWPNGEA
jgi:isopentenyldiphosphate isomerase